MNFDKGLNFIGGFLLGGIVGAAVALLMAPASGQETLNQIRSEGVALKHRGQQYTDDKLHDAQNLVKKGQRGVSEAQARVGGTIQDQKDNLQETFDAGKQTASQRKDEMVNRFQDLKAHVN